jgi:hypothetical protein
MSGKYANDAQNIPKNQHKIFHTPDCGEPENPPSPQAKQIAEAIAWALLVEIEPVKDKSETVRRAELITNALLTKQKKHVSNLAKENPWIGENDG